jgi:tripartite-type tricarboxylate transporter receptor subunit TctC
MRFPRRKFLHLAAGAAALPALPSLASALRYPTRPVHVVVGFPAGTTVDIIARLVCEPLSQRLGQRFIVDDRPGAASNIGTALQRQTAIRCSSPSQRTRSTPRSTEI